MDFKKIENFDHFKESEEENNFHAHIEEHTLKDYDQFVHALNDARNQFQGVENFASINPDTWLEHLHNTEKMHFIEYLATQNKTIDDEFMKNSNIQSCIKKYNEYIDKLRETKTKDELDIVCDEEDKWYKGIEKNLYNYIYKEDQFWDTFLDLKNQFVLLEHDFRSDLPIEEILEKNKSRVYKNFNESLLEKNRTFSKDMIKKFRYEQPILDFDDISKKAANFTTKEELAIIIEEINEFLGR